MARALLAQRRLWDARTALRIRQITAIAAVTLSGVLVLAWLRGIVIVTTPSVPMGIYLKHRMQSRSLRRGDYVCLDGWRDDAPLELRKAARAGSASGWILSGQTMIKAIAAVQGSRIDYDDAQGVLVDGRAVPNSRALARDRAGVPLPKPAYPTHLGPEQVWLSSTHPRGFDSRYFGPVQVSALSCRAELLWSW